jgi:hypothetical protein
MFPLSAVKMGAEVFSEMLVSTYQTTRSHYVQEHNVHLRHSENLRSLRWLIIYHVTIRYS